MAESSGGAGAGARVLKEVLRTPAFVELIKTNAFECDPENAREFVRTLLFEDVALALGFVASLPSYLNYMAEAAVEMGRSMSSLPAPLLNDFAERFLQDVDSGKIAELPEAYGPVIEAALSSDEMRMRAADAVQGAVNAALKTSVALWSELEGAPGDRVGMDARALGQLVTLGARAFNRRVAADPYVLRDVMRNVDGAELLKAVRSMAVAVVACVAYAAGRLISLLGNARQKDVGRAGGRPVSGGDR